MNSSIFYSNKLRQTYNFILIVISLFVVVGYVISVCSGRINADAAYYIGTVRLILEGKTPFIDFSLSYTPLSFYIMSLPFMLFGSSYEVGMMVLLIINLLNATVFYKICYEITNSKRISWLGAIMLLLYGLVSEGGLYVLEPFVLLFGLPAIYLLFKDNKWMFFGSGLLCFCAYWCKQYGLGFLFLAMAFVLFKYSLSKESIKKVIQILVGFFVGAIIFIFLLLIQKIPLSSLFALSGSDYQQFGGLSGIVSRYYFAVKLMPLIIIALVIALVNFKDSIKNPIIIVSILGIAGFMLQFYFRPYRHYFLLALPFFIILIMAQIQYLKNWHRQLYILMMGIMLLIPSYYAFKDNLDTLRQQPRSEQWSISKMTDKAIKPGSVDVFASKEMIPINMMNNYTPPMLKKYGLSGGFVRTDEATLEMISNAQYCLISERDLTSNYFNVFSSRVKECLDSQFDMEKIESFDNKVFFIYKRKQF